MADAREFWIQRGAAARAMTLDAVAPGSRPTALNRWRRQRLMDWALTRARAYLGKSFGAMLDLGSGYGDFTAAFARQATSVRGCDASADFAREAERRALAACADVRIVQADVRDFAGHGAVRLAHLGGVLTYLEDADVLAVLHRLRGAVVDDGLLISRDWCAVGLGRSSLYAARGRFSRHRRPAEYAALARRAGWWVVDSAPSHAIYAAAASGGALRAGAGRIGWRTLGLMWRRASVSFAMRPA